MSAITDSIDLRSELAESRLRMADEWLKLRISQQEFHAWFREQRRHIRQVIYDSQCLLARRDTHLRSLPPAPPPDGCSR